MLRRSGLTTGLALILTSGALAQDAPKDPEDVTLYRVFVGDHAAPRVTVFDLDKPDNRWSFETSGQNKLYGVNNGAAVVAVQSDSDTVHFFKSGIKLDSHGDHSDIEITDPSALAEILSGPRPFHLIDITASWRSISTAAAMPRSSWPTSCRTASWRAAASRRRAPITVSSRRSARDG